MSTKINYDEDVYDHYEDVYDHRQNAQNPVLDGMPRYNQ